MPETGKWNGHTFVVSPVLVRGFTDLAIKGSSKTEDKVSDEQGYAARKSAQPREITMTVGLFASLGCDVRSEAMAFVDEACEGAEDYLYVGGKKLVECSLMLTEASVEETDIAPSGTWVKASVKLTFKQATRKDGKKSGSSGGSGNGGGSTKKQSVKYKVSPGLAAKHAQSVKSTAEIVSAEYAAKQYKKNAAAEISKSTKKTPVGAVGKNYYVTRD